MSMCMFLCLCLSVFVTQELMLQLQAWLGLQASSELDIEVKKLTAERQRLATEVQMKREMEQQYAKRCTLQVSIPKPLNHM